MRKTETWIRLPGIGAALLSIGPALTFLLLMCGLLGAADLSITQEDLPSLETRLVDSEGMERLELLVEITERYNSSSPPTALEFAQQSLDLLETHPDPATLARVTHQMCWAYQNLGDYRTALTRCNQSAAVAEKEDNEKALARALNTTGVVFWRLADFDRSIDFLLRAHRLEEAHGSPLSQSRVLTNMGIVQKTMGNYDSALDFYSRSLEIKEREGDTRGIANVLNNMAEVYFNLDRLDTALDLHRRSLALKEELGYDVGAITSHMQIGMIYSAQDADDLALASFLEALRLADKTGVRANQSAILTQLGVFDRKAGLLDLATEKLTRALDLATEIEFREGIRDTSLELARTYELLGDHKSALDYYKRYQTEKDEVFSAESRDRIAQLKVRDEINRREAEIRRQRMVRTALLIGLAGLTVLLLVALRAYQLKTQANLVIHRTNKKLKAVDRIVTSINSEVEFDDVLKVILSEVIAMEAVDRASFLIRDQVRRRFAVRAWRGAQADELEGVELRELEIDGQFRQDCKEQTPDLWSRHQSQYPPIEGPFGGSKSLVAMMVRVDGRIEGILALENHQLEDAFSSDDHELLQSLKEHIRSAFIGARWVRKLQDLSAKKSEVIRIAAHDFRNPVGALMNNMELLAMGIRDGRIEPQEVAEKLDKLQAVGEKTIYSLERLLDLSAIELGKGIADLAPHDLTEIIEECLPPHRQAATRKDIKLLLDQPSHLPQVLVDADRIGQVLDNLVSNAIKYTHPGGAVRVECETQPNQVITHVRDTGQGLRPDDLDLVFRSFRSLSATPTGGESSTGLGLAIAKGIVEVHGGEIWVESRFGIGSCFSFSLPAA
jgi:signal transduction histidine kinase/tetratricopeptide (TPR) repeat protein